LCGHIYSIERCLEKGLESKKKWCEIVPAECDKMCLRTGTCSRKGREPKKKDRNENQH
jgi:hypothetical protein